MTVNAARIMQLVQQVMRARESSDRETCSCYGVTPLQGMAVVVLGRGRPLNMQQLSDKMQLAISTMSRVVDRLVENRLVRRIQDPDDRRVVLCVLTEKGLETARQLEDCHREFYDDLISKISPEDLKGFISGLEVLVQKMQCCPPHPDSTCDDSCRNDE